jgi:hypothetical protein
LTEHQIKEINRGELLLISCFQGAEIDCQSLDALLAEVLTEIKSASVMLARVPRLRRIAIEGLFFRSL